MTTLFEAIIESEKTMDVLKNFIHPTCCGETSPDCACNTCHNGKKYKCCYKQKKSVCPTLTSCLNYKREYKIIAWLRKILNQYLCKKGKETIYERITRSPRALAKFLHYCDLCVLADNCNQDIYNNKCINCFQKWLNSPSYSDARFNCEESEAGNANDIKRP
jgi:hypothetical protein